MCPICDKPCDWGQRAIACDECNHWYHATCTWVDSEEYLFLSNESVSWYCVVCNAPNHSTVLFDSIDSADSNTFSVLSSRDTSNADPNYSSLSDTSFGEPMASSSLTRPKQQQRGNARRNLRILVTNFQSFKNKRNDLQVMIESTKPDVILGTETWLSDTICTSEIFPPKLWYDVIRRDRDGDAHGGVLIAATTELGLNHLHTSKDSELIAERK
ncbi:uncharacterized protein LOC133183429 [Saccostrea echinata]|uniref:uncharacterized protein LOC133183429 n=1 Tax=Saccostrea echinata TaxID=191078 RepID=UPI002A7EF153|nr:uncharacterized protein LOC133183429 [Saccostrea echinata]